MSSRDVEASKVMRQVKRLFAGKGIAKKKRQKMVLLVEDIYAGKALSEAEEDFLFNQFALGVIREVACPVSGDVVFEDVEGKTFYGYMHKALLWFKAEKARRELYPKVKSPYFDFGSDMAVLGMQVRAFLKVLGCPASMLERGVKCCMSVYDLNTVDVIDHDLRDMFLGLDYYYTTRYGLTHFYDRDMHYLPLLVSLPIKLLLEEQVCGPKY